MVDVNKQQQILIDMAIRRFRKFYFNHYQSNITLETIFNNLLTINGTYTVDNELNKIRETVKDVEGWK